ncbi:MAG: hypothetical protein ACFWUC_05310 [Oscillospiraceae bacterium]
MYKLIFADDEKLVRDKISQMVDWESHGFSLVGCCSNGYDLMELIEREVPDLVILDINMPFINGLEASRQIRHSYPHIRLVFLTGFTEFEYAKQAVEVNALKYIVKPVTEQELHEVLCQAREALDEERKQIQKMTELMHCYKQNQVALMQDILRGSASGSTIYDRASAQGLDWSSDTFFQVAVFSVDRIGIGPNWLDSDEKTMLYALCNVTTELAQQKQLGIVCMNGDTVVLIGYSSDEKDFSVRMQEFVESILHLTSDQLQFSVTAGLGNVYQGYTQITSSFNEAMLALKLRAKEGGGQLFTMQDLQEHAGGHAAVWDAVNYIESTYADPNLSADAVCSHLHLSPSYLRALFKRHTGSTIIGYITKARMERARTLLEGGKLKNSQIAERVGYTDPHYFSYCFKRYFGVSVNEMREKIASAGVSHELNAR